MNITWIIKVCEIIVSNGGKIMSWFYNTSPEFIIGERCDFTDEITDKSLISYLLKIRSKKLNYEIERVYLKKDTGDELENIFIPGLERHDGNLRIGVLKKQHTVRKNSELFLLVFDNRLIYIPGKIVFETTLGNFEVSLNDNINL